MVTTIGESRLAEIARDVREKSDAVQALYEKCGDDGPRRDDYQTVVTLNKEIEELLAEKKEIEDGRRIHEIVQERRATLEEIRRTVPFAAGEGGAAKQTPETAARVIDLAKAVLGHEKFGPWLKGVTPGGSVLAGQFGPSPVVALKNLISMTNPTTGQAFSRPMYDTDVMLPMRPLGIRNIITVGRTSSDVVSWVEQTGRTNNAAPWPEPGSVAAATSKPESDLAFTPRTTPVVTIATYIPATRNSLSDVPQLEGIIRDELTGMVEDELEEQIINGDGTGNNMRGILGTANLTPGPWDTDLLTTTRKARTLVRTVGRAVATAYVLNPMDWEALDLTTDATDRYYFGGPMELGTPRLWGLPVVESEFIPQGVGLVGDMRVCKLYDREQAAIYMTDSHSDWFTKNLLAILAELRAAFAVRRPAAIVDMDLTAVAH